MATHPSPLALPRPRTLRRKRRALLLRPRARNPPHLRQPLRLAPHSSLRRQRRRQIFRAPRRSPASPAHSQGHPPHRLPRCSIRGDAGTCAAGSPTRWAASKRRSRVALYRSAGGDPLSAQLICRTPSSLRNGAAARVSRRLPRGLRTPPHADPRSVRGVFALPPRGRRFGRQFPLAITPGDLSVSFLISLREDSLAKLDRFKGRIPTLWDSYRRVDHLDRAAARRRHPPPPRRIQSPPARRALRSPSRTPGHAVLSQVQTGNFQFDVTGSGAHSPPAAADARIETPTCNSS